MNPRLKPFFTGTAMALGLATGLTAQGALADCLPDPATDGASVVCASDDTNGFEAVDAADTLLNNVTVTVNAGVTVSDDKDGIRLEGLNNTVFNNGTVHGDDDGIVGGAGLTVINTGAITANDKAIDADDLDNVSVINTGSIVAGDKGIRVGDGAFAYFENHGSLESGDEGFEAGDYAVVINDGLIRAFEDAVQTGEMTDITNTGTLFSYGPDGDGADVDSGTIQNFGRIETVAASGAGIDVDTALNDLIILNSGTIRGGTGILVEDGTHDVANEMAQSITNLTGGVIDGFGGTALFLAGGDDLLFSERGSHLIGAADFGTGKDTISFDIDFFDDPVGALAGGALLDGGAGFDVVKFLGLSSASLLNVSGTAAGFTLTLAGADTATLLLANWESFEFTDKVLNLSDILPVSAVPLPAGVILLGSALGLMGFARRRA